MKLTVTNDNDGPVGLLIGDMDADDMPVPIVLAAHEARTMTVADGEVLVVVPTIILAGLMPHLAPAAPIDEDFSKQGGT